MSNYKNKPVILAGLTALLLLAASCTADAPIVFEEHAWKTSWPHKPTISQESKDAQQMKQMISDNTRERMLKNLIEQYKLIGMSKEECMKLLGPEDTECRSGRAFRTGCELCYTLAPSGYDHLNRNCLYLFFRNGKVASYETAIWRF